MDHYSGSCELLPAGKEWGGEVRATTGRTKVGLLANGATAVGFWRYGNLHTFCSFFYLESQKPIESAL